jgi:hypothetical protein
MLRRQPNREVDVDADVGRAKAEAKDKGGEESRVCLMNLGQKRPKDS